MNRRRLLALIGFAPIAGVAAALPRPADPVKLAEDGVGREISAKPPFIFTGGTLYLDDVVANTLTGLQEKLDWVNIERANIGTLVVGTSTLR